MSPLEGIHSIGLPVYREIVGFIIILLTIAFTFTHLLDADVLAECIRRKSPQLTSPREQFFYRFNNH